MLARGDEITLESAPAGPPGELLPPAVGRPCRRGSGCTTRWPRYERQLIEAALRAHGGVQKQAAELLGLKPTTLNEKIKRLGIRV